MATHANVHRVGLQNRQLGTSTISPVVETIMRLGYIVRGLIYAVIGVLAVQVAVVGRGTFAESQGAIVTMSKTPLGKILLYVILVGLVGYAFWGLVRGMFDALHRGTSPK